ncbi:MAG TPA: adenylate/guanylate cyclase domain-containing protein [Treponemataceae bacterium]|nr:adenylate/guanylate cyclase domain-containing protein [Treponemataceae bacterium]
MAVKKYAKLLKTRNFGLCIGLFFAVLLTVIGSGSGFFRNLEPGILDSYFSLKEFYSRRSIQKGVWFNPEDDKVSSDIVIVGVDLKTLQRFGSWPFPRSVHADLVNSFSRISDQSERERALLLDFFFIDDSRNREDDEALESSIRESDRVFLESILEQFPSDIDIDQEMKHRQSYLDAKTPSLTKIGQGWKDMASFQGLQTNLAGLNSASRGYGAANMDFQDTVVRRQPLVFKYSELVGEIAYEELVPGFLADESVFERLSWFDSEGLEHQIEQPLTEASIARLRKAMERKAPPLVYDADGDGVPETETRVIEIYRDSFYPSIALSLALHSWNAKADDCSVLPGKEIRIARTGQSDAVIPVDYQCAMWINFAGRPSSSSSEGYRTFPVRSYAGYVRGSSPEVEQQPETRGVKDKILLVGAFEKGMADDEKQTPYGMMFGIEIHANALNTLLTERFIDRPDGIAFALAVFLSVMLVAFLAARMKSLLSLPLSLLYASLFYLFCSYLFDEAGILLNYSVPAAGMFFTYVTIILYRATTEERDKRKLRNMFGKYVSPDVVAQMLDNPPELGGVDRDLTVFFSDIRGFTSLSETLTPQELVKHLNEYLSAMTDIILETGGTLDKYVGDEIMCFWGAPLEVKDHASRACKCALLQKKKLEDLNNAWPQEKRLAIGIGINTGVMTVGNMGSEGRMNYTLMGDNVNLGARLEGTNKMYGTMIIVSEYTYALVRDEYIFRELDIIRVKGKNKPVVIYELVDWLS